MSEQPGREPTAPGAEAPLTPQGRYLREAAAEGNPNMEPWGFVPCAREHKPGYLCILPDGHTDPVDRPALTDEQFALLTGWFETYLTHERFIGSTDADLAEVLAPTVQHIVAAALTAERERIDALADEWKRTDTNAGFAWPGHRYATLLRAALSGVSEPNDEKSEPFVIDLEVRCPECGVDATRLPPCSICGYRFGCCPCFHSDDPASGPTTEGANE